MYADAYVGIDKHILKMNANNWLYGTYIKNYAI